MLSPTKQVKIDMKTCANSCEFHQDPQRADHSRNTKTWPDPLESLEYFFQQKKKTYSCTMSLCHYVALTLPHADRG